MANFKHMKWFSLLLMLGAVLSMLTLSATPSFASEMTDILTKGVVSVDTIVISTKKRSQDKGALQGLTDMIFEHRLPVDTITKMAADIIRSQVTTKSVKVIESPYIPPKTVLSSGDVYQNTLFVYIEYKHGYGRLKKTYEAARIYIYLLRQNAATRAAHTSLIDERSGQAPLYIVENVAHVKDYRMLQEAIEQNLRKDLLPLSQAINCVHDPLQCK